MAALLTARIGREVPARAVRDEWRIAASGRGTDARRRPTQGLPDPQRVGKVLLYPRDHVDKWLESHPSGSSSPLEQLTEQLRNAREGEPGRRLELVRQAKVGGMSWATITKALNDVDGRSITRQAVAKAYGPHV